MKPLALLPMIPLLSACLPWPKKYLDTPRLDGKVVDTSVPVAGLRACVRSIAHDQPTCTMTDAEGRFSLPALSTTSVLHLMGDRVIEYRIEFERAPGDTRLGYQDTDLGGPPDHVALLCDLAATPSEHADRSGFCSAQLQN